MPAVQRLIRLLRAWILRRMTCNSERSASMYLFHCCLLKFPHCFTVARSSVERDQLKKWNKFSTNGTLHDATAFHGLWSSISACYRAPLVHANLTAFPYTSPTYKNEHKHHNHLLVFRLFQFTSVIQLNPSSDCRIVRKLAQNLRQNHVRQNRVSVT